MMPSYDLSIIVPAKNSGSYIEECLQSLVDLDSKGFTYEVLMVDDGSTDNTREIMDQYSRQYDEFLVVDGPSVNLAQARIEGLKCAKGRYIGWVDSDDFVHPEMYRLLLERAWADDAQVVLCNYDFYPGKTARKKKWFRNINGLATPYTVERNTQLWNKIFQMDFLKECNFIELLNQCSDGSCSILLAIATRICTVDKILYYYRVGHLSMSADYSNVKKYLNNVALTERQESIVKERQLSSDWNQYFEYRVLYSLMQAAFIAARNNDRRSYSSACKELVSRRYLKNPFLRSILSENHGAVKAFALSRIVPRSWTGAKLLARFF